MFEAGGDPLSETESDNEEDENLDLDYDDSSFY
jgi:hypothetical protein